MKPKSLAQFDSKRSSKRSVFRKPYLPEQFPGIYPGWRNRSVIPSPKFAGASNELPNRMVRTQCLGNAVQPIIAHYLLEYIKEFNKIHSDILTF